MAVVESILRDQLLDRRRRLEQAVAVTKENLEIHRLIAEVDSALARMEAGTYGLCEVCREPIETERLIADLLVKLCLGHMTPTQQRALENDLELAAKIQKGLLPNPNLFFNSWEVSYHYEPAGLVSGDYCDLLTAESGDLYFILGDVSGKGVSASMLMVHLHAMFRTLISLGMPLRELMERASRVFCESTLPTHYATLVCGKADASGAAEICNAGHLPPLLVSQGQVERVDPTGLPVGAFCDEKFATTRVRLEPGQTLLLYTDGLSEARNVSGEMYGHDRLQDLAIKSGGVRAQELVDICLNDLAAFRRNIPLGDDLTLMVVGRSGVSD